MKTVLYEGTTFPVEYCELCEADMIICPKCGNNTCNGGYGEVDGSQCDLCPTAYEAMNEKLA